MKRTYITLLRGINVSGHKTILMDDLKELFEKMDFEEVKTYIQSGNIIFRTKKYLYRRGTGTANTTIGYWQIQFFRAGYSPFP